MAGGARGEVILDVGEEQYTVLMTNRALAQVEQATGKSILQLARAARTQALGMNDVAQLLYVGLEHARREARAGGRSYTINDAWRILDALGFATVAAAVLEAVAAVLAYDGAEEGENPPA